MSASMTAFLTAFFVSAAPGLVILAFIGFQWCLERLERRRYNKRSRP